MEINVTFLGTSNALPTKQRNHPAILLNYNAESILFDCGEGTQRQFRLAKLNPCKLTKIFLTHLHGDHTLGLPGLLATLGMSNYSKTLEIYGPVGTRTHIEKLQQIYGKFGINLQVYEKEFENKDIKIESLPMSHGIATNGYTFIVRDRVHLDKKKIKKLKLPNSPILGELHRGKDITYNGKKIRAKDLLYEEKGKRIAIVMDTGMNENAVKLAKNSDLLICEATYADEEIETAKEYKHLTASQAATIAKKAKAKKLILTHISQRYEYNIKKLEKEAKKIFKYTSIAKDLDTFKV